MDISIVRTEKKYGITWGQKNALLHRLEPVIKVDQYSGTKGYMVRSLYFDSIYDNDYFDKISGLNTAAYILT